jgi:DNA-binding ferritin-like protein (Dps family)
MQARHELSSLFEEGSADHKKYLDVVDKRVTHLCDDTLMVAGNSK